MKLSEITLQLVITALLLGTIIVDMLYIYHVGKAKRYLAIPLPKSIEKLLRIHIFLTIIFAITAILFLLQLVVSSGMFP